MKSKKFVPMKIWTDDRAYKNAQNQAKEKIEVLKSALEWCSQHINSDDISREMFLVDMSIEFERLFTKKNKGIVNKELSYDKLLFLLDVNTDKLVELQNKFNSYESKIMVTENGDDFKCQVDSKDYTTYTKNPEENKRLIVTNNLVNALDMVEKYAKVYPLTIQQATSQFVRYDITSNKYRMVL